MSTSKVKISVTVNTEDLIEWLSKQAPEVSPDAELTAILFDHEEGVINFHVKSDTGHTVASIKDPLQKALCQTMLARAALKGSKQG